MTRTNVFVEYTRARLSARIKPVRAAAVPTRLRGFAVVSLSAPRTLRSTAGRGRRGAPTVPRTPPHASGRAGPPPLPARSRRQPRAREPRPAQQPLSATLLVRRGPKRRDRARAGARRDEVHAPPTRGSVPPPRARHATCSRLASR